MSTSGDTTGQMNAGASEPIVEDPNLPMMPPIAEIGDSDDTPTVAEGDRMKSPEALRPSEGASAAEMLKHDDVRQATGQAMDKGTMEPHDPFQRPHARPPLEEQIPPGGQNESSLGADERYFRLRVVGSSGRWRITDQKLVEGPLAVPDRLRHGWAWEVRYGGERLGIGLIPDIGETRGFPDPEGRPGMEGHHLAIPSEIEFIVRIPEEAMRALDVDSLEIELYKIEDPPSAPIGREPLGEQFPDQLTRFSPGPVGGKR